MLLLIFIALLQELLLIHNLQIYSYHPTYNYKDQIVEDKQGYHHFLLLLVRTLGSGSLNATTILQTKFKDDLLKQQVVQIVIEAIEAVMWIILLSQKVRYKNLEMLKLIQLQHQLTFDKFYDYQSMQLNVNITLTKSQFFFLISKLQLTLIMKSKVQGLTVCKNFRLSKCLGTGAFGEIYLATNKSNQQQMYAAKLQEVSNKNPQLFYEAKIYKYLNSQGGDKGIPKVHAITTEGQYNIMLIDLLGKSLEDLFVLHNKKFTLKTVLFIADQMLQRIQFLHSKQFLHRDIKPDNFLMGRGKKSDKLYLIDLGLSKKYIKDGKHIPYKDGKELTGTARYASINTHIGIQQSRRDDIQSIGYVLMYFLRGILPWQNMKGKDTKQKYHMIMQKKMSTPTEILCKGYPNEFITYLNYAKNMKFQDKPDYTYLRKLFEDVRKRNNIQLDGIYDWNQNNNKITQNVTVKNIIQKPSNNQRIQIKVAQNIPKKELPKDIRVQNISKHKYSNVFGNSNKLPTSKISTINQTTQKVAMISSQKVYGPKISIIKQ